MCCMVTHMEPLMRGHISKMTVGCEAILQGWAHILPANQLLHMPKAHAHARQLSKDPFYPLKLPYISTVLAKAERMRRRARACTHARLWSPTLPARAVSHRQENPGHALIAKALTTLICAVGPRQRIFVCAPPAPARLPYATQPVPAPV